MNYNIERIITHNLCSVIFDDIEKIVKNRKDIVTIIKQLVYQTGENESNILANYSNLKLDNNKIYIYSKENNCFSIDYI